MPLMQYPGRVRLLGPPSSILPRLPGVPGFAAGLAAQRLSLNARQPTTPFSDYTGRSVGSPVGMFGRVPGFGRMFRG